MPFYYLQISVRDEHCTLYEDFRKQGHFPGSLDDTTRFLYNEAEQYDTNDGLFIYL